jgi:hypothetical protein
VLVEEGSAVEQRAQLQQDDAAQVEFQAGLARFERDQGQMEKTGASFVVRGLFGASSIPCAW